MAPTIDPIESKEFIRKSLVPKDKLISKSNISLNIVPKKAKVNDKIKKAIAVKLEPIKVKMHKTVNSFGLTLKFVGGESIKFSDTM